MAQSHAICPGFSQVHGHATRPVMMKHIVLGEQIDWWHGAVFLKFRRDCRIPGQNESGVLKYWTAVQSTSPQAHGHMGLQNHNPCGVDIVVLTPRHYVDKH